MENILLNVLIWHFNEGVVIIYRGRGWYKSGNRYYSKSISSVVANYVFDPLPLKRRSLKSCPLVVCQWMDVLYTHFFPLNKYWGFFHFATPLTPQNVSRLAWWDNYNKSIPAAARMVFFSESFAITSSNSWEHVSSWVPWDVKTTSTWSAVNLSSNWFNLPSNDSM